MKKIKQFILVLIANPSIVQQVLTHRHSGGGGTPLSGDFLIDFDGADMSSLFTDLFCMPEIRVYS